MTREEIRLAAIDVLAANDRNGVYTDADCELEGFDPTTLEEVREIVSRYADDDEVTVDEMARLMGFSAELWAAVKA
jgi:hypothetical protein